MFAASESSQAVPNMSDDLGGSSSVKIMRERVLGSTEQGLESPPDCIPQGNTQLAPPCHMVTWVASGMQSDEVRVPVLGITPGCKEGVESVPPGCEAVTAEPELASAPVVEVSPDNTDSMVEGGCAESGGSGLPGGVEGLGLTHRVAIHGGRRGSSKLPLIDQSASVRLNQKPHWGPDSGFAPLGLKSLGGGVEQWSPVLSYVLGGLSLADKEAEEEGVLSQQVAQVGGGVLSIEQLPSINQRSLAEARL